MKIRNTILLFLLLGILTVLNAKDYIEKQYRFSIEVPDNWGANTYMDGTDKVYDFLSADENAFIQVRSFKAGAGLSMNLLIQVFEENYLPAGKQRQSLESITSTNGIPGKQGSYLAQYNGQQVGISVFYVIQKGQGYTLMGIVPTSMFQQKQEEISKILKSFIIPGYERKEPQSQSSGGLGGLSGKVQDQSLGQDVSQQESTQLSGSAGVMLTNIRMGDQLNGKTDLLNQTTTFVPSTGVLYVVFDWQGDAAGKQLNVKWFFDQNNILIDQSFYEFPANEGSSNASLSKPTNGWPLGDYHLEFSVDGKVIKQQSFVVVEAIPESNAFDSSYGDAEKTMNTNETSQLFAGSQIKAKSVLVLEDVEEKSERNFSKSSDRKQYSDNTDPYNVAAQRAFWQDVSISDGEWKAEPLKSSMMMKSLSSGLLDRWQVMAVGTRKSTMYASHMMTIRNESEQPDRHSFSFFQDNKHYVVDDSEDICSLSYRYSWMCGRKGMIMFSGNGGTTWYVQQTSTRENLKSISFANTKKGIAVGQNATILVTNDGGQHWQKVQSPLDVHLEAVEMVNENIAYIIPLKTGVLKAQVMKTTDGGQSWKVYEFDSYTQSGYFMNALSFADEDHGWICADIGNVFYTENGGQSWTRQGSAMVECAHQGLNDIYFVTKDEGWACGNKGTLLHTENGGRKWKKVDLGIDYHLYSLEFNGPYAGWVAGLYNLFSYTDEQVNKYAPDFYKQFKEPHVNNEVRNPASDNTFVIKAYEIFDFEKRAIVPMNEFSGYGFYLAPATDKLLIMGGLLPTDYSDINATLSVNLTDLYCKSSNQFSTIPLNKVCACYASGSGEKPKLIFQKYELVQENGEQIPQVTFRIVYP